LGKNPFQIFLWERPWRDYFPKIPLFLFIPIPPFPWWKFLGFLTIPAFPFWAGLFIFP